jgi:membrane-associated HD superfamily phosphohydrolase
MAKLSNTRQKAFLRKYSDNVKYLMMAASICLIVFTLPKQAKFRYEYDRGRIWTQKDLVSPYNFAILKTQSEIENDQRAALRSVTPVYQYDSDMEQAQLDGFKNDLEIKWHNSGISDKKKQTYLNAGGDLLKEIYDSGILNLNPKYQQNQQNYPIQILDKNVATDKNTAELYTKEKALAYCDQQLSRRKDIDKAFLLDLIQGRLQNNLKYDDKLTARLEKEVLEGLSQTRGMVQKGEVIVAKGSVINDVIYQKLESFKNAFYVNSRVN